MLSSDHRAGLLASRALSEPDWALIGLLAARPSLGEAGAGGGGGLHVRLVMPMEPPRSTLNSGRISALILQAAD